MSGNVFKIMIDSIGDNVYIIVFAVIAAASLVSSVWSKEVIKRAVKSGKESDVTHGEYYRLDVCYTFFITLISIFPLLGMFGTVSALLSLDMSGDMAGLKDNFFLALTSTAWGIVFAIVFKIINAVFQPEIENYIAKAKQILKL